MRPATLTGSGPPRMKLELLAGMRVTAERTRVSPRICTMKGYDTSTNGALRSGTLCEYRTRRSGSANGSGRSSTASTTLKTAVLAPMPRASAPAATAKKRGRRDNARRAQRRSVIPRPSRRAG